MLLQQILWPQWRFFISGILAITALAYTSAAVATLQLKPPNIEADSYLLQDMDSGRILVEYDIDTRLPPASLTKLMTAYVTYDQLANGSLKPESQVTVSEKAWKMRGSRMFLEVGKQVTIDNLISGLVIQSGNDAAVTLAEAISGSEDGFADLMNAYATKLGMTGSNFTNSSGWPDKDLYTTTRDIAILTRALIHDFPQYYARYSIRDFTYNGIKQYNRNPLLGRDARVDGVKTGYTEAAGHCLVASAQLDGMRLISVVMGADSEEMRARESRRLLDYGFRHFKTYKLYDAYEVLDTHRVWESDQREADFGIQNDLYITIQRGTLGSIKRDITYLGDIVAPVRRDTVSGEITVSAEDGYTLKRPLVLLQDVDQGGFFRRYLDKLLRYMR